MKNIILLLLVVIGAYKLTPIALETFSSTNTSSEVINQVDKNVSGSQQSYPAFSCDGRQHCSQMTSRAEAEFFTRYCPDTKMDGDNDGIPCENDSRW